MQRFLVLGLFAVTWVTHASQSLATMATPALTKKMKKLSKDQVKISKKAAEKTDAKHAQHAAGKKTKKLNADQAMKALPQVFSSINEVKSRLATAIQGNDEATKAAKSEAVDQISAEGDALGQAVGAY